MNRRKFFGLLTAAGAALAVPELLLPSRTFFLPPAGGWRRDAFQMRFVQQWVITDEYEGPLGRFDAIAHDAVGTPHQYSVNVMGWSESDIKLQRGDIVTFSDAFLERVAAPARSSIAREFRRAGLTPAAPPSLPLSLVMGAYV